MLCRFGLLLIATGIALPIGGAILLFTALSDATSHLWDPRTTPAASFPVDPQQESTTPLFQIKTDGLGQIELEMRIRTPSLKVDVEANEVDQQGEEADKERNVEPQYNFPVEYRVLEEQREVIQAESARAGSDSGMRSWQEPQIDESKGEASLTAFAPIGTFQPPPSGRIQIQLDIQPDELYHAELHAVSVRVYENIPDSKLRGIVGGALCCASPLLLIAGIVLLAYGPILVTTRSKKRKKVP